MAQDQSADRKANAITEMKVMKAKTTQRTAKGRKTTARRQPAKAKGYDLATHPEKLWPLSLEGMTVLVGSFVLYERRQAAAENPEAAIA